MPILIVDETHADILATSAWLKPFSTRGTVAFEDACTALTWCTSNQPRLVLLDFDMARLKGLDFLRYMRALPTCRKVPVIMLTAADPAATAPLLREAGVAAVLHKPLDADAFAMQVERVLAVPACQ